MFEYEIIQVDGGFGYTITDKGNPWIIQPYDSDQPGFAVMTEERAEQCAKQLISHLVERHNAFIAPPLDAG